MESLLEQIALCTERGKLNKTSPYPPDMKEQDGVDELTKQALDSGVDPNDVLTKGLMIGMNRVGAKFGRNEVFVPDLLMAANCSTVESAFSLVNQGPSDCSAYSLVIRPGTNHGV